MINDPNGSDLILALWLIAIAAALLVVAWVAYRTGVVDGFDDGYAQAQADDAARRALAADAGLHPSCVDELHDILDARRPDAAIYQFQRPSETADRS